jgi:hypothetical protein
MSIALADGVTSVQYNLGPVKPWVQNAAYIIGPKFGIKTIGGWRATDPFPDHPSGHALDFMIPNLQVGQQLADYAVANATALNIKYIIFNHRVWNPKQGWHPYTSTDNPHTDHVHITFNDAPGTANGGPAVNSAIAGGGISQVSNEEISANCAWHVAGTCLMTKVGVRMMFSIGVTGVGVVIALVGTVLLVKYAMGNSSVGGVIGSLV